jgi:hypothetical protein
MTLRAYARHRGVWPNAVVTAIEYGRLTEWSCTWTGTRWQIDAERAAAEWLANTDESYWEGRER